MKRYYKIIKTDSDSKIETAISDPNVTLIKWNEFSPTDLDNLSKKVGSYNLSNFIRNLMMFDDKSSKYALISVLFIREVKPSDLGEQLITITDSDGNKFVMDIEM